MDGRTVGTNWYGTVHGTDFWYGILFGTEFHVPNQSNPDRKSIPRTKIRTGPDFRYSSDGVSVRHLAMIVSVVTIVWVEQTLTATYRVNVK